MSLEHSPAHPPTLVQPAMSSTPAARRYPAQRPSSLLSLDSLSSNVSLPYLPPYESTARPAIPLYAPAHPLPHSRPLPTPPLNTPPLLTQLTQLEFSTSSPSSSTRSSASIPSPFSERRSSSSSLRPLPTPPGPGSSAPPHGRKIQPIRTALSIEIGPPSRSSSLPYDDPTPSPPSPISPITPHKPLDIRHHNVDKLRRHLGEPIPTELVFRTSFDSDTPSHPAFASANHPAAWNTEPGESIATKHRKNPLKALSWEDELRRNMHVTGLVVDAGNEALKGRRRPPSRYWLREKKGKRWVEEDYTDVLRTLRNLR